MRSPTQQVLTQDDVAAFVHEALGATVTEASELSGGGFAAVWRVTLGDDSRVVLKVGPPPGARLLGYEHGLINAEARYFRLVRDQAPTVPVPEVLHHGDGWLVTTYLPGRTLAELRDGGVDDSPVRKQLGAAVAALHTVKGDHFGYDGPRTAATTWPAAFAAMVDGMLDDAAAWGVALPSSPAGIRALVSAHAPILAQVTTPVLVHFDLWDGNVLTEPGADGRLRMTGLVDGERYLWADPLLDFVSPALFARIEDDPGHPFLRGYADATGRPAELDGPARTRLTLYRMFFYLLMLTEGPSRGLVGEASRDEGLTGHLRDELATLQVR